MREISKLLKKPTQRDTHMELVCMIAKNELKGIHTFCPAPWAVRGGLCSLSQIIMMNLQDLQEWSLMKIIDED